MTRRLLDFGAFVLEPNFYLRFVESQLSAELLPSSFSQVTIFGKFVFESGQLGAAEGSARPFVVAGGGTFFRWWFFRLSCSRTWKREREGKFELGS